MILFKLSSKIPRSTAFKLVLYELEGRNYYPLPTGKQRKKHITFLLSGNLGCPTPSRWETFKVMWASCERHVRVMWSGYDLNRIRLKLSSTAKEVVDVGQGALLKRKCRLFALDINFDLTAISVGKYYSKQYIYIRLSHTHIKRIN